MNEINKIEGLENFEENHGGVLWIKILNSSAATTTKKMPGTVVVGKDNEVLAESEKPFNFVPIYYFTDWAIWSERVKGGPAPKLIKRTFDKKVWSDGSKVLDHEVNWTGTTPPVATESLNFVVIPQSEIKREVAEGEERRSMILTFQGTNSQRRKCGRALRDLIALKAVENKVNGIYQLAVSLTTKMFTKEGTTDAWYDFDEPTFIKVVNENTTLIGKSIYAKVRELNKSVMALEAPEAIAQIEAPKPVEVIPPAPAAPISIKNPLANVAAEIMSSQPIVDLNADF